MAEFFIKPGTELRSPKRNYKVIKVLGHGGFGITYLAESVVTVDNIPITARFALKEHFINSLCSRDPQTQHVVSSQPVQQEVDRSIRAFISEAQRLQKLGISHSNIVKVNEVFEANNTAYFVMEYLDGGSLADYVQGRGRLSFAEMSALMEPVCNSVAMLHRNSVAHYDIKPQNIMLVNRKGILSPVLIDFGLAKHYDGQGNATSSIAAAGYTPGYAPMEQYAGFSTFQPTADVYALGATILFCLTGHNPASAQELDLDEVRNELTALNLSAKVVNALLSALEFRSKDRPADAGAFAAAIFDGNFSATTEKKYSAETPVSQSAVKMPPKPQATTPSDNPTELISEQTSPRKSLKPILIIAGVVLALVLGYFVISNNYTAAEMHQKGKEYYDKEQYSEAVPWFRKAADQGHAKAQYILGACYYNGQGVTKDYSQAAAWFRKAAEQGYAQAQYWLGSCYYNGYGVTQDYTQAVAWYRKAAEQGIAEAQCWLGVCYGAGQGVTKDDTQAVAWIRKAAEQGYAVAQYVLGMCYERGDGVTQDYTQAVAWYRKAVEQGDAGALYSLGYCYYNGWGVTQDYTQAVAWFRKAAEQGYANAQYNLGWCYENGEGVTQDKTQAVAWWRKAAEQGYADAQYNLGVCYFYGNGVMQNKSEALYWLRKAAEQGNEEAKQAVRELESQGYR